jgi:phosphatidylglycerophosphate synthase
LPRSADHAFARRRAESVRQGTSRHRPEGRRRDERLFRPADLASPHSGALANAAVGESGDRGLVSLANTYAIYLTLTGAYALVPVVFAVFFVVVVVDCVDGEIARYRLTANPIGGKLLDGAWHKATEYGLLVAYATAAYAATGDLLVMPLGLLLVSGEGMYTYVYERRLTVIRVYAKSSEYINPTADTDLYRRDERWRDFSFKKKLNAFKGLILYKSVYFMILLSAVSATALLYGVVLLMIYKHYAWIKMLSGTVNHPPQLPPS